MAKWGQGDPRWIVEERPDATNVNNWHWSDKDASSWSEDKLKSLLLGILIEGKEGKCRTTDVNSCNGEATVNNRKGKLIFFYEWSIKLKWEGSECSSQASSVEEEEETKTNTYSGEIEIPNLSEENDVEDIDVIVSVKGNQKQAIALKELMHRESGSLIRARIQEYLRCLKQEYSKDLILPKRDSSPAVQAENSVPNVPPTSSLTPSTKSASRPSGSPIGCRIYTAKVVMTESFLASVEDLYNALTEKQMVEAFTQCKAVVEAYKGGVFSLMDGHISGEFLECVRPSRIVQKWRLKSWPDGHYSTVVMELKQHAMSAELSLHQTEVPESDCSSTKEGWRRHIFQRIKNTFGYGMQLF